MALREYFSRSDVNLGKDPEKNVNARFCQCLTMTDHPPPLRVSVTVEEKQQRLESSENAWVWILDVHAVVLRERQEHDDGYCGWLRLSPSYIQATWFRRLMQRDDDELDWLHEERPEDCGTYYVQL